MLQGQFYLAGVSINLLIRFLSSNTWFSGGLKVLILESCHRPAEVFHFNVVRPATRLLINH
jgi:hypothetical protein